jgi:hypothetical protein
MKAVLHIALLLSLLCALDARAEDPTGVEDVTGVPGDPPAAKPAEAKPAPKPAAKPEAVNTETPKVVNMPQIADPALMLENNEGGVSLAMPTGTTNVIPGRDVRGAAKAAAAKPKAEPAKGEPAAKPEKAAPFNPKPLDKNVAGKSTDPAVPEGDVTGVPDTEAPAKAAAAAPAKKEPASTEDDVSLGTQVEENNYADANGKKDGEGKGTADGGKDGKGGAGTGGADGADGKNGAGGDTAETTGNGSASGVGPDGLTAADKAGFPENFSGPEVAIILSRSRFYPSAIRIRAGQAIKLVFTSVNKRPAALIMERLNVQRWMARGDQPPAHANELDRARWEVNRELTATRLVEIVLKPSGGIYSFHDALTGAHGEILAE